VQKEDDVSAAPSSGGAEIKAHMELYAPIKASLAIIEQNVVQVNALKSKNKTTATEKQRKEVMAQLDKIMDSTSRNGTLIKRTLDSIKKQNTEYETGKGDSARNQLRSNLYQTNVRKFHSVMTGYNSAVQGFQQDLKGQMRQKQPRNSTCADCSKLHPQFCALIYFLDCSFCRSMPLSSALSACLNTPCSDRNRREIQIIHDDWSDQAVDEIIESGRAQDVIKEALISDNVKNVVQEIEERHMDILKLERQVLEIMEMFKDLATMVDLQQESLDVSADCTRDVSIVH
jgi:t-SNARE complex subunit (syntaxin)